MHDESLYDPIETSNSYSQKIIDFIFNAVLNIISWRPVHLFMLSWFSFLQKYTALFYLADHNLLSYITIAETIASGESGMNPVAKTIINAQKEIGASNRTRDLWSSSSFRYRLN